MKKFNEWYLTINEELTEPTVISPAETNVQTTTPSTNTQSTHKSKIISDVDAIMTSLETLSVELKEQYINESGLATVTGVAATGAAIAGLGLAAKRLYDAKIIAPKARKEQSKVNALSLKIAGIEDAVTGADTEQKAKIKAKLAAIKTSRDELQDTVNDRYADASTLVKRAISTERAKGKMSVLKMRLGEATPNQEREIKDQLNKLKNKIVKDEALFNKEVKNATTNISPSDKNKIKELTTQGSKDKSSSVQTKIAKTEAKINQYAKNIDDTNSTIKENEAKVKQLQVEMEKATDKQKFEEAIKSLQQRIREDNEDVKEMQAMRSNLKKELSQLAPKESLIIRANNLGLHELATEISQKEAWQLNNTTLYIKYNETLTKLETTQILNESKYTTLSIKDRFSRLL